MKIKEILSVKTERKPGWLDRRFGEHFARISTVTTRKLKYAIRDVARFTYGKGMIPYDIERLAKAIQTPPQGVNDYDFVFGYEEAGRFVEGTINTDPALKEYVKKYPNQWKIVVKCLSLVRNSSLHACGYVIASRPIREFMPLSSIKGTECTEFTANSSDGISSVEGVGGIKYDYLKLNSLKDVQIAVKLIQKRSGLQIPDFITKNGRCPKVRILPYKGQLEDIWTSLPEEPEVFSDISNGDTESVFQLSTQGALKWLKLFNQVGRDEKPLISSVRDIAIFTALDRPGPLDIELTNPEDGSKHNALVEYVRRARGLPPSEDILEVFDKLFPETKGILVFQEQLQRAYQTLTGCSGAEADEFRSNVAKKRATKVAAAYETFVKRAGQILGSEEKAAQVFQAFGTWSNYGFCLAHAVSYARLAYVIAFLKRHFPLEWWTAVLSNATKDDISDKFWPKCSEIIDLPDMSNPRDRFDIVNERIQAPIGMLWGVGGKAQEQIVAFAPYSTIDEFCGGIQKYKELNAITTTETKEVKGVVKTVSKRRLGRSAVHSGVVYSLVVSGAMDSLFEPGLTLEEKLLAYEKAIAKASGAKKHKPVKPQFKDLNAYNQFLMRKKLLPVFTQSLPDLMVDCKHPLVSTTYGKPRYKIADRFVDLWGLKELRQFEEHGSSIPSGGYRAAIPGYVSSVRRFTFDGNKEACAIALNIEGVNQEFVKWPDWNSKKLDPRYDADLEKSLLVLHVVKRREDRPFVVENFEVLASNQAKP